VGEFGGFSHVSGGSYPARGVEGRIVEGVMLSQPGLREARYACEAAGELRTGRGGIRYWNMPT
jgi:hypothetical protein